MTPDLHIQTAHALASLFRSLAVIGALSFVLIVVRSVLKEMHR